MFRGCGLTCKATTTFVYHSIGSMTDVPHSVAVETEKNNILKNNRIGDVIFLSETRSHPLDCNDVM